MCVQQNNLEFELRLQQYIELIRSAKLLEAMQHARKYLVPYQATHTEEIRKASALLAFSPGNVEAIPDAYKVCIETTFQFPPSSASSQSLELRVKLSLTDF